MPDIVKDTLIWAINIFILLMIVRLVVDLVMGFNPDWRPSGAFIMILEITYTITDPPLKLLRRFIPPLHIGRFALDLSFIVTMISCSALKYFIQRL